MSLTNSAPKLREVPDSLAALARHILFPALPAVLRHVACEERALDLLSAFGTGEMRFFGIEVPLRPGEGGFDLGVNFTEKGGSGARLARDLAEDLASGALVGEAWTRCAAMLEAWCAGEARGVIDRVWLEFDLRRGGTAAYQPNIFAGPADSITTEAFAAQLPDWFDRMTGTPPDAARAASIRRLARGTGQGVAVFQAGAMIARPGAPVRLCLRCQTPVLDSGVLELLDDTTAEILRREAAWLSPLVPSIDVAIDVLPDGNLVPRLGLEARFEMEAGVEAVEAGVAALGAALVARGLADPARAAAPSAVEGLHLRPANGGYWPNSLRVTEALTNQTRLGVIMHGLHHVKVTANRAGEAEAKAYLYYAIESLPAALLPTANQAIGAADSAASPLRAVKREAEPEPRIQAAMPASDAASESDCSAQPASSSASR